MPSNRTVRAVEMEGTMTTKIQQQPVEQRLVQIQAILTDIGQFAIAVSGGIDSTLLAVVAGRLTDVDTRMIHAVSPAVPPLATKRVRKFARDENWTLDVVEVGEFDDERYLSNPIDRCFYCKTNLYGHIGAMVGGQIVSGTNCDDLSDFRPGLKAAENFSVRHPYVEAGIDKNGIREIARMLSLHDLSELPASPCLSSRIETGIRINGDWLRAVDEVEALVRRLLECDTIRCRIRSDGIDIELDQDTLARQTRVSRRELIWLVRQSLPRSLQSAPVNFRPYKMGSAFVAGN